MLDLIKRLRERGTPLDIEAAEMFEGIIRSVDRSAAVIPEQTPAMLKTAEDLKQSAMDRGHFPGVRRRAR